MSGVSGKTDMLVVGHKLEDGRSVKEGSKYRNADQRDVQILDEKQFEKFIEDKAMVSNFVIGTRREVLNKCIEEIDELLTTTENDMWTEQYKPTKIRDIVGNTGVVNNLFDWLKDWDDVQIRGNKKQ